MQREQKNSPQTLKEKVVEGKKNWSPNEEEKIVGHPKKTKRPLVKKEMKLGRKKCPILEERENLKKKNPRMKSIKKFNCSIKSMIMMLQI